MMTSSLYQTCSIEMYSYIVQALGLITAIFGIWRPFLLIICHIASKKKKKRAIDLSHHQHANITENTHSALSFKCFGLSLQNIGTLGSFILMMTKNCKLIQKKVKMQQ